jgi:hypothetical protein
VSPLLEPILASTARTPGHTDMAAEQRKASLYTSVCAAVDIRFVPLAQVTFGGWSGMASHQICLIADRRADSTGALRAWCRNALFRAFSIEGPWVTKEDFACLENSRPIVLYCSFVLLFVFGGSQLVVQAELPSLFCRVLTDTPATYSSKQSS